MCSITKVNFFHLLSVFSLGFPGGLDSKESTCNAVDLGSVPELGRSLGKGNGNPLQYSCLENPKDRGAWWATVHRVAKSWTQLSDSHFLFFFLRQLRKCVSDTVFYVFQGGAKGEDMGAGSVP